MEEIIVLSVLALEKLEKDYGRLGMIVGVMIILVTSIAALFILAGVSIAWFKIVDWSLRTFFDFGLF